ncbi:Ig-like domain-containing protein [Gottfriedia sp. OAE603]|uniref:Ig-like domain-containing protein n=1 Tax=Gottfriedia sp. OAE603 TaxID=2663872 RepID=UPI00178AC771
MKSFLLKVGILSALTVSLFNGTASAETASVDTTWSSKCSTLGQLKQNVNPSFQHINCLLTNAAINADIPPEVVKAIAWKESGWKQFVGDKPLISDDNGIGIMQVTDGGYDTERLKNDIAYNIQIGVNILNSKYSLKTLPKIKGANRHMIENWYFSVMAYNGIKPVNSPLHQDTGEINNEAYQEEVFRIIEEQSFINETKLARYPFKTTDFDYVPTSDENIKFLNLEYTLTSELHQSAYFYKLGEKVLIAGDKVNLRSLPTKTPTSLKQFVNHTPVIMNGAFEYDKTSTSNQFVWIPVKTVDRKVGYVASPYIYKMSPVVSGVTDGKSYGKAVTVRFNEGTATLNGKAFANGGVVNKADSYTLIVRDAAGKTTTVKFTIDLTPPALPTVNKVTSKTIKVTGKAEKYSTVEVYRGSSLIGTATTKSTGSFTVKITKAQKKSTILKVYVKDKAGNVSKKAITVL